MNNDLISRDALKKALHNFFDGKVIDEPAYILRDVFCHIDNAPTVEDRTREVLSLQETIRKLTIDRPHGKAIIRTNGDMSNYYICSECHYSIDGWDKFCRNCGASMDMRGKK